MALPRRTGADPIAGVASGLRARERVRLVHGRLLAGLAVVAALAALAAAPAGRGGCRAATWWSTPGAEAGPGAPDSSQQLPLPGWTVESTFTAVQYGAPAFLTAADSAALGGGVNFFAGGPGGALSAATQVVDLSGAAAEIDAGEVTATLSALLGGFATQTDHATVVGDVPERRGQRRPAAIGAPDRHRRPIATRSPR